MSDAPQDREPKARRQPETLRLRSISPTLTVSDLDASVTFYRDVVGFMIEDRFEQEGSVVGVSLKAGAQRVVLSQDDWSKGRDRTKGVGMRLYFETAQSVDDLAARIRESGGELAWGPGELPWGVRAISMTDPDGFQMTITEEA